MARTSRSARPLTDHEEIRQWAEERDARPACVRRTGGNGDVGMIRLDFPGYSGEESLEEISWDEWLQKFDESNLALMVQDETASGKRSNFNKLVGRETAAARERGERTSRHHPARGRRAGRGTATRSTRSRRRTSSRESSRNRSRRSAEGKSRGRRSTRSRAESSGRTSARGRQSGGSRSSRGTSSTSNRAKKSSPKNPRRSGTTSRVRAIGRKSPARASESRSSRRRRGEEAA